LASKVAATRGATVLPAAVAAAGRTPVLIGRLTMKAAKATPGHTDLPSTRKAAFGNARRRLTLGLPERHYRP
jgi:hypothetical protein